MAKTFELSNSYSYAKITWSETNNIDNNSSIVSIDSLEIKTKSYYGVTYFPKGTIKVNGTTVVSFDSIAGTHAVTIDKAGTYYKVLATSSASANAPWKTGTIAHNADGTKDITITVDIALYTRSGGYGSGQAFTGSKTEALTDLPKCAYFVSAPNFFDTDNPTITYINYLGDEAAAIYTCISLTGANDDIPYREIDKNGSSYTFYLAQQERDLLCEETQGSNSRTVRFYLKTLTKSGETIFKHIDKQFTVSNCLPEIDLAVADVNPTTLSLTDDETRFIKGESYLGYEITATPKKGAHIVSYSAVCGSEELTTATGTFMYIEHDKAVFTIKDSRGNRATREVELDMLPYYKPTISADAEIELSGETEATVTITATGNYYECDFGLIPNILSFQVRYKANSGEYGDWEEKGGSIYFDENGYKATLVCDGLEYLKGYTFQVRAHDLLNITDAAETKLLKLIPVFDWSESDFNFNVPVKVNGNLTVTGNITVKGEGDAGAVDYIIEQGTAKMGSNGTWYWSKWKSGKAECYGCCNYGNMGISTVWGSVIHSEAFSQSFPSGLFADTPAVIQIEPHSGGWISRTASSAPTATETGDFIVCRASTSTLSQVHIGFNVIGRWQ